MKNIHFVTVMSIRIALIFDQQLCALDLLQTSASSKVDFKTQAHALNPSNILSKCKVLVKASPDLSSSKLRNTFTI